MDRLGQRWRLIVTAVFLALLLSPLVRPGDGVPLSSYPMYASPRSPEVEFVVAHAIAIDGATSRLSIEIAAATSDPLIAETRLRNEVAAGRADALCREIAGRAAGINANQVELRAERHDVVARVQGRASLLTSEVVAACPV